MIQPMEGLPPIGSAYVPWMALVFNFDNGHGLVERSSLRLYQKHPSGALMENNQHQLSKKDSPRTAGEGTSCLC